MSDDNAKRYGELMPVEQMGVQSGYHGEVLAPGFREHLERQMRWSVIESAVTPAVYQRLIFAPEIGIDIQRTDSTAEPEYTAIQCRRKMAEMLREIAEWMDVK